MCPYGFEGPGRSFCPKLHSGCEAFWLVFLHCYLVDVGRGAKKVISISAVTWLDFNHYTTRSSYPEPGAPGAITCESEHFAATRFRWLGLLFLSGVPSEKPKTENVEKVGLGESEVEPQSLHRTSIWLRDISFLCFVCGFVVF